MSSVHIDQPPGQLSIPSICIRMSYSILIVGQAICRVTVHERDLRIQMAVPGSEDY